MAIDFTRPIFIVAVAQGERLAVLGGSNNEAEARDAAAIIGAAVLLRCELADGPPRLNDDGSVSYVLPA